MYTECTPTACMTYIQSSHKHARTRMRACGSRCLSCIIFVRLKESVIRSAISSRCWSLPHLLTSHLPQHEAQPGLHDLLRDDTEHQESFHFFQKRHCRKATLGRNAKLKNHSSHINYESAGNVRRTLPQVMSPKCLRPRSLRQFLEVLWKTFYQFFDVQREFGEQDQQAPESEEVKSNPGTKLTRSPDAEMSFVEKISYLQSQMHFDESVESIVDSDLEDGELQKLLTSPLHAQRASGKPDAMVVQERDVSAPTSHSS